MAQCRAFNLSTKKKEKKNKNGELGLNNVLQQQKKFPTTRTLPENLK